MTAVEYNQLDEPVAVTRGAETAEAIARGELLTGEAPFGYETRIVYDFNGRVVRAEVENRDSTTAGVGTFVDYTSTYDLLHNRVESTVEIDAATTLTMQYRYDENELLTLLTRPEGNKVRVTYDERNLVFTITRGFESTGASTIRLDYDLNANLSRFLDAEEGGHQVRRNLMRLSHDTGRRVSSIKLKLPWST